MSNAPGDVAVITITSNPDPDTWPAWIVGHRFNASDLAYAFLTRPYSHRDRPHLTGVDALPALPDGLRFTVRGLGAGYVQRTEAGLLWSDAGECWDAVFFAESGLRRAYQRMTGRVLVGVGKRAAQATERTTREAAVRAVLQAAAQPLTPTEIARALGEKCRWAWCTAPPVAHTKYLRDLALAVGATWLPGGKYVLQEVE